MLKKSALVTGGAGFIGSHLCEKLLTEGFSVVALDDLSTGSKDNLKAILENPEFQLIVGNITDKDQMRVLMERCDMVYHLAAAVGVKLILEQPIQAMKTNIRGAEIVLDLADQFGKSVFIASSSEVYGKGIRVPFSENDDTLMGPTHITRWSYASSKAIDEFLGLAYYREKNLDVTIARYFNTVGPRQSAQYGMVIPRLVKQAIVDLPMTVYGSGKQTRTFNHVTDTIDATYRLSIDKSAAGRIYNIGGGTEISIRQLAEKIKARIGSSSPIHVIPYNEVFETGTYEDMQRRVPDLSRLDQQIGYKPAYSLDIIIDQIIDHFTCNAAVT